MIEMKSYAVRYSLCLSALVLLTTLPALAQQSLGLSTNSKEPVEITADRSLEWHRAEQRFLAKSNAKAKQGEASIRGDMLVADYRDGQSSSMEIYMLKAIGGVVLNSADNTAYGDEAIYDLDKGLATLTGEDLKMISPDQTVTAQDRFEYMTEQGLVNAIGGAKVVRPKLDGSGVDTLEADKITAQLAENAVSGKREVETIEAFGNVVITTPTEVITGKYGIYRSQSNKAELQGGVRILRGPNILEGERAEVDLNTNISKIFGSKASGGQVKGVFYPNSR